MAQCASTVYRTRGGMAEGLRAGTHRAPNTGRCRTEYVDSSGFPVDGRASWRRFEQRFPRRQDARRGGQEMFMHRSRRVQRWLVAGAFSVGLALVLSFAVPTFFAAPGYGIAVAQSDDDDDERDSNTNDNAPAPAPSAPAPAAPSAPAAPMPMPSPSPSPSTGSGTGTSTGTSTQSSGTAATTPTNQTGCVMPAANVTERRMFNLFEPSCLGPSR
jgi:hypothetical protein